MPKIPDLIKKNVWRPGIGVGVSCDPETLSRDMLNHELPSLSPVSIGVN